MTRDEAEWLLIATMPKEGVYYAQDSWLNEVDRELEDIIIDTLMLQDLTPDLEEEYLFWKQLKDLRG